MRRVVLIVGAIAAATLTSCGGDDRGPLSAASVDRSGLGAGSRSQPLGVVSSFSGSAKTILTRLGSLSLKPVGPQIELGEYHDAWSFSPDRSRLALGISASGIRKRIGIRVVDLARMKVLRDVETGIAAEALGWIRTRALVAILQSGEVVLVDPETGRILTRRELRLVPQCGVPQWSAVTQLGFVVLLAEAYRVAPAHLLVVDPQGRARAVRLRRIRVGARGRTCGRAGLAVDVGRDRAFVLAARAPLAEVDLQTMRVRYSRIAGPRSLPAGRPRRIARCRRRTVCNARREALWLGAGLLAVSGQNLLAARGRATRETPAGVAVIDTAKRTGRMIDRRGSGARFVAGKLLVFEKGLPATRRAPGIGLRAYSADGRRLFHRFGHEQVWDVQVADGRAYARSSKALRIVDAGSGRLVGEFAPTATEIELLGP